MVSIDVGREHSILPPLLPILICSLPPFPHPPPALPTFPSPFHRLTYLPTSLLLTFHTSLPTYLSLLHKSLPPPALPFSQPPVFLPPLPPSLHRLISMYFFSYIYIFSLHSIRFIQTTPDFSSAKKKTGHSHLNSSWGSFDYWLNNKIFLKI